jgi:hypothetical protein
MTGKPNILTAVIGIVCAALMVGAAMQTKRGGIHSPLVSDDVVLVRDSFNDGDRQLSTHSPEMGGAWSQVPFARNAQLVIVGNQVEHSTGPGYRTAYNAGAIFNDDQFWEVTVKRTATDGGTQIYFRLASEGSESGYALKYDPARGGWVALSVVPYDQAQCSTPLCNEYEEGAPYTDNFPVGQSRRVRVNAIGNVLTATIQGVQAIQITDTDHPHGGRIAISLSGNGFAFDDFVAGNLAGAPTPTPTPSPDASPTPSPGPTPCANGWRRAVDTPTEQRYLCIGPELLIKN